MCRRYYSYARCRRSHPNTPIHHRHWCSKIDEIGAVQLWVGFTSDRCSKIDTGQFGLFWFKEGYSLMQNNQGYSESTLICVLNNNLFIYLKKRICNIFYL